MTLALLDSRLTAYQLAPLNLHLPPLPLEKRNQSKLIRQNGGWRGVGGEMSSPLIQNIFPASLPPPLQRGEKTRGYLSGVKQLHLEPPESPYDRRHPPSQSLQTPHPPPPPPPPRPRCGAPARPARVQTLMCKFGRFSLGFQGKERSGKVQAALPFADFSSNIPSALKCIKRFVEEEKQEEEEKKTYLKKNGQKSNNNLVLDSGLSCCSVFVLLF